MRITIYRKAAVRTIPMKRNMAKGIPAAAVVLMILGAILVGTVVGPIAGYFIFTRPGLANSRELISPLPAAGMVAGAKMVAAGPVVNKELDYRRPENWFPGADFNNKAKQSKITDYNLSIVKLGINNATVTIGGEDLGKSLIHYPGTANPGEMGSTVIFGHSVLRQFYNPQNYVTIFSKIMTLDKGNEILVNFDGVKYTYRVIGKVVVKPTDVEILEQRFDGRYLKLITCVPEGTYLARGVVIAELK